MKAVLGLIPFCSGCVVSRLGARVGSTLTSSTRDREEAFGNDPSLTTDAVLYRLPHGDNQPTGLSNQAAILVLIQKASRAMEPNADDKMAAR
ncbi:unnamed protein product [Arctogadus glacialis]